MQLFSGHNTQQLRKDIDALFLIFILPIFYFMDLLFTDTLLPEGDWYHLFYPARLLVQESFQRGQFPLWNPYEYLGSPLFASWQVAVLYPLNLIFFFLSPAIAIKFVSVLNIMIAGLGMYLFARKIFSINISGALVSAISFMFCGFFSVHFEHINQINVAVWIPLLLFCFHRSALGDIANSPDWNFHQFLKYGLLGGIIFAFQLFGGHPQIVFYILLIWGFYSIGLIYFSLRIKQSLLLARILCAGLLIGSIGSALSAIQWIPALELSGLSLRQLSNYERYATFASLPPQQVLTFLFPHSFGDATGAYWGRGNFTETTGYMGLLPLFLALLSVLTFKKISSSHPQLNKKYLYQSQYLFLVLSLIIAFFFALGKYNPVYPFLYKVIYPLQLFRCPARMLFIMDFSLSLLAGYGAMHLSSSLSNREDKTWLKYYFKTLVLLILLALPVLFIKGPDSLELKSFFHQLLIKDISIFVLFLVLFHITLFLIMNHKISLQKGTIFILCLFLFDLFHFSQSLPFHWLVDRKELERENPMAIHMQQSGDPFRTFRILDEMDYGDLRLPAIHDRQYRLQPNLNILYRIPDMMGYEEGLLPTQPFLFYVRTLLHQFYSPTPNTSLMGSLNIKYLLSDKPITNPKFHYQGSVDKIHLFENSDFMPLVYWVPHAQQFQDGLQLFSELTTPTFSPQSTVLFIKNPGIPENIEDAPILKSPPPVVSFEYTNPAHLDIQTETERNGFLVISIQHYPGWVCKIDNQPVPVFWANGIVSSVYLPKGIHQISYTYQPASFQKGRNISLLTLVIIFLLGSALPFLRKSPNPKNNLI